LSKRSCEIISGDNINFMGNSVIVHDKGDESSLLATERKPISRMALKSVMVLGRIKILVYSDSTSVKKP